MLSRVPKSPALFGLIALTLTACGGSPAASPSTGIAVVASTRVLGDLAGQLTACGGGATTTLVPEGADPHDFSLSSQQATHLVKATLVVTNGLELEHGMEDVLDSAAADGAKVFTVADKVDPIPFGEHAHEGESGAQHEEHDHGSQDPHFWLDGQRGAKAAEVIAAELARVTGDQQYVECGRLVHDAMLQVDQQVVDILAAVPADRRVLVTDHEAFGYFAQRYQFDVAGVVVPGGSTEGEPSSADVATLVETIRHEDVHAIFSNTAVNPKLVEAVAKEVGGGVTVVPLNVETTNAKEGVKSYADMLTSNAQAIARALTA